MLLWILLALFAVLLVGVIFLLTVPAPIERWMEGRIQQALRQHYGRDVRLQNLHVTLIPEFEATFDDFELPDTKGEGLPPFMTVRHVTVKAATLELLRSPVHISWAKLDGLQIHVPPKGGYATGKEPASLAGGKPKPTQPKLMHLANFVIDQVDADGTRLYVLRKDPAKEPMEFDIRKLTLRSAGVGRPMKFLAELNNPKPPGAIQTSGSFGPWNFDDPGASHLAGHYSYAHADLSVFNGISGILSSVGDYTGQLNNIVVDGTTDTPDFQLDRGAASVHLTTKFHAIVDGTNGDTYLDPVKGHFLHSNLIAEGDIAGKPGQKGKYISLNVDVRDSYLQDLLQLAAKSEPPAITGRLRFTGDVLVPPGKEPVLRKLKIDGNFHVTDAKFTHENVRSAITELSRRGQGKPGDQSIQDVPAEFGGVFRLQSSNLDFSDLQFMVPGAIAQMKGSYGLSSQQLDFVGDVRLNATVSQVVGGKARWVLAPFDPIFMKHGAGTYIPLEIKGTREQPQIKVNWKKLFLARK
jgi:hypothetical protein